MKRRDLLLAGLVGMPGGRAALGFPLTTTAGGRRLVLSGVGTLPGGWWSGARCHVGLYEDPEPTHHAAGLLRLVEARFLREATLDSLVEDWQARLAGTLPPAFRAWLRPARAGDVERQVFQDGSVVLEGPGRLVRRIDHAGFARQLLDTWIGPEAGELGSTLRGSAV